MENYIKEFDNYKQANIYNFEQGKGGIGDCLKYFLILLNKSIKEKKRLYYLQNNIDTEKYLKLKYEKMYIDKDSLNNLKKTINCKIVNLGSLYKYLKKINHSVKCDSYQKEDDIKKLLSELITINQVFIFDNSVIENSNLLLNSKIKNYISLHVRLGDKFLETDKKFVFCKQDKRDYNKSALFKFIEENKDKNIIFFCDNNQYKLDLKKKYNDIIILDTEIGHTSLSNTTEKQVLDTVTEFYIMCHSDKIVCASMSGFPLIASKFNDIPLTILLS